jgi:hypothetical protein
MTGDGDHHVMCLLTIEISLAKCPFGEILSAIYSMRKNFLSNQIINEKGHK